MTDISGIRVIYTILLYTSKSFLAPRKHEKLTNWSDFDLNEILYEDEEKEEAHMLEKCTDDYYSH